MNAINQSKRGKSSLILAYSTTTDQSTRGVVLADIMKRVESEAQDDFMMWLFGPAGAGKSAFAKKIAELSAGRGLFIGTLFFSRTSSTRNTKDRLITTLAYQRALNQDPAIFKKNIETQIDTLLIQPLDSASTQTIHCPSWLSSTRRM